MLYDVSVLIPVLNGGDLFRQCLAMVLSQRTPFAYEVVVVDSGSSDGTWEYLESLEDPRLIKRRIASADFNHGETRNFAASLSAGRLLVFLVQDAVPASPLWLDRLTQPFCSAEVSGVYARQIPRPDSSFFVKRSVLSWITAASEKRVVRLKGEAELAGLTPWQRYVTCYFDNVCSAIRRTVWERIPFEKVPFGEDILWSRKALLAGESLAYEPSAVVVHSHDRSLSYLFKRICLNHCLLYRLFGLETIPSFKAAVRCAFHSFSDSIRAVLRAPLKTGDRIRLLITALPLAVAEVSAQYWGVRYAKAGKQPAFRGV